MRWLLVAALTGGANANGCCDSTWYCSSVNTFVCYVYLVQ
jgi:hypothetical protein